MNETKEISSKGGRVRTIVRTCNFLARVSQANPEEPPSHTLYYRMLADYYSRVMNAREEGGFVAAHTVWFPVEILYAMDVVPMHTEITTWMTALFSGNYSDLLTASAQFGLAQEICSPYRILTGALSSRSMPHPDAILWSNLICDNNTKIGATIQHMVDCPGFFMDYPFQETPAEIDYLKEEIRDLIHFLEKTAHRRLDWDRLSKNIALIDREIELGRHIIDLRRTVPSPFPSMDFLKIFTVDCLFAGTTQAVIYLETVRDELEARVKDGKGISYPERFRIMNMGIAPVLLHSAVERTFREHCVVSVSDPLSCDWEEGRLDPEKPLESVIQKMKMNPAAPFYGPLTERIEKKVIGEALSHRVDGAIFYAHMGCRQSAPIIKILKDALASINVPLQIIDCDMIDITVAPEADVCGKLEQFFELLEDK